MLFAVPVQEQEPLQLREQVITPLAWLTYHLRLSSQNDGAFPVNSGLDKALQAWTRIIADFVRWAYALAAVLPADLRPLIAVPERHVTLLFNDSSLGTVPVLSGAEHFLQLAHDGSVSIAFQLALWECAYAASQPTPLETRSSAVTTQQLLPLPPTPETLRRTFRGFLEQSTTCSPLFCPLLRLAMELKLAELTATVVSKRYSDAIAWWERIFHDYRLWLLALYTHLPNSMQAFALLYDRGTNTLILNDASLGSCSHVHPKHQQHIIEAAGLDFDIAFAMSQFVMGSAPPGSAPHVSPVASRAAARHVTDATDEGGAHAEAYGAEAEQAEQAEAEQAEHADEADEAEDFFESHSDELAHQLAALAIVPTKSPPARDTATDRLCSHVGGEAPSPHSEQAEPMHSSTESTDTAGFGTPRARLRLRKSTPAGAPEYQREYFLQLPRFPPSSPFWPSRAPCKQSRQTLWIPQVCFSLSRAACPCEKVRRWRARVPA